MNITISELLMSDKVSKEQIIDIMYDALNIMQSYNGNTIVSCLTDAIEGSNICLKEKMKIYKIAVTWTETGTVLIEDNNLESAIEKAEKTIDGIPLPHDGEYLDESFQIDKDTTKLLNEMNALNGR